MTVQAWIDRHGGIVHRSDLLDAGFSVRAVRASVVAGAVRRVRRYWLCTTAAPGALVRAAHATGHLSCLSAARHHGWWVPPDLDDRIHLRMKPHAAPPGPGVVAHWSRTLVPLPGRGLVEAEEDTLAAVASCQPREAALVIWESAMRNTGTGPDALLRVSWPTPAARDCALAVTGLADSGLETMLAVRLSVWGVPFRQQVKIAGHHVDVLIGDRLVIQIDGFAYHSSSADRGRDLAHDRELGARGYTVLRFTYAEVVFSWPQVQRAIALALAQSAHLAR